MGQKQNPCSTDKARIYLREFASEQITPKEQEDELLRMNISKDKLFRPWYRDYFSLWSEPWVFSQWTQESFITHRRHISRMWTCQEQHQNSGTLAQILKQILKFIGANTKKIAHGEPGSQGTWISSRLPESRSTKHAWKLSWTEWNYSSTACYWQHLVWMQRVFRINYQHEVCISHATFTATIIRPAEGQAMCMTNGISSVKVWPILSFGSPMGKILDTLEGSQNRP